MSVLANKRINKVDAAIGRARKYFESDPSHPDILEAEKVMRTRPEYLDSLELNGLVPGSPEAEKMLKFLSIIYLAGKLSSKPIN